MELKTAKHKGLKALLNGKAAKGIDPVALAKIRLQLSALQAAPTIHDVITVPGWRLEQKRGPMAGTWSMWVTGNYRLTFRLETPAGPVLDLDFLDYH